MLSNILDRISFWALFAVIVLLPVFFLPFVKVPVEISKGLLLVVGLSVAIIFWIIARFSDGKIVLPKSWLLVSGFGIVLSVFLSSLFSPVMKVSFFGTMLETETFYFILAAFLLMLFSAIIIRDKNNSKMIFLGVMISSFVVFVFQILRLFFPEFLSFGILGGKTSNLLGSWNALGLFAGFSAIVSLFSLEFFSLSKLMKIFFSIFIILSILLIAVINFSTAWVILGVFALIIFVYKVSFSGIKQGEDGENKASFPAISFAIVMISLLFIMAGQFIGGFLSDRLQISNLDIRPSVSASMSLTKSVIMKDPVFGAGANRFPQVWALYKPAVINNTLFWDSSFNSGMSTMLTSLVTNGILGIIALLAFVVLLVLTFVKSLFVLHKKNGTSIETALFFFMAIYLFVSAFFYSVGPVILLLAFATLGIFIGVSTISKSKDEIVFSFLDNPRKSFFSILLLVLLMIVVAGATFKYIQRFVSVIYFQSALSAQSMDSAESSINKALSLYTNDLYLRTYAQVYLIKLNSLVSKESLSDADKAELKINFDKVINGAQMAVSYDKTNYLNLKMLGSIYQAVGPLGVEGAYSQAIEAYKAASLLNPLNPGLKLMMAQASFADKKTKEAKEYTKQALLLKPDYIDALITYSQLSKSEGNNGDALLYAQAALSLAPQNKDLIDYVNSLKNNSSSNSIDSSLEETQN